MNRPFTFRRSGTTGHEILDPDGLVIAWTVDAEWAGVIVGLLNEANCSRSAPRHDCPGGQGQVEADDDPKR